MPFENTNQVKFDTVTTRDGGGIIQSFGKRTSYESSAPVRRGGERTASPGSSWPEGSKVENLGMEIVQLSYLMKQVNEAILGICPTLRFL